MRNESVPLKGDYFEKEKKSIFFNMFIFFFALFMFTFVVFNLACTVCSVDGPSMNNTLSDKDTLLLEKNVKNVRHGDIVTITGMGKYPIIKRVMGLDGDRLVFRIDPNDENCVQLFRSKNSGEYQLLDELDYIDIPMQSSYGWGFSADSGFQARKLFRDEYLLAESNVEPDNFDDYAIKIGKGECFVMGDNRNISQDSRYYGVGQISNIQGRMFYKVPKNSVFEKILLFIYKDKSEGKNYGKNYI